MNCGVPLQDHPATIVADKSHAVSSLDCFHPHGLDRIFACIHFMACSVKGKYYLLLACPNLILAAFNCLCGRHCPRRWTRGMWHHLLSYCTPTRLRAHLHVISTSSSLCTVTPSLVKMDMFPLSLTFPTLIGKVGNLSKESALATSFDC